MKFINYFVAATIMFCSMAFIGCTKDEAGNTETPQSTTTGSDYFSVDVANGTLTFSCTGGTETIYITTIYDNLTLVCQSDSSWCTVKSNSACTEVAITVSANSSSDGAADDRSAEVTLTIGEGNYTESIELTINQTGYELFNYASRNYDPNGHGDALVFDDLPTQNSDVAVFSPSSRNTSYAPITVLSTSSNSAGAVPSVSQSNTRILSYMTDFVADYSPTSYKESVNKYGSRLDKMGTATGRYHTEKIDGRWWIVDPEGYLNIQRGLTSINNDKGNESGGTAKTVWNSLWGNTTAWFTDVFTDLNEMGFNATGAFCSSYYTEMGELSGTMDNPISVTPILYFAGTFKNSYGGYPDGSDNTECAVVLHDEWYNWCKTYVVSALAAYDTDPDIIGFFSDNELKFCSNSMNVIDELLAMTDTDNYAYIAAMEFITENGYNASSLTQTQKDEFAGLLAERYFGGIKAGVEAAGYELLYLGSRLHGRPKQVQAVIEAAGRYCDIISINYYNRWSVEHTGTTEGGEAIVSDYWESVDAPFMVTEFYTKGYDCAELSGCTVTNEDGEGWLVPSQADRGYFYQHFTLGLLESTHCVGWHWFRYQDDEGGNRGFYDRNFVQWESLSKFATALNYNVYSLADYFLDK